MPVDPGMAIPRPHDEPPEIVIDLSGGEESTELARANALRDVMDHAVRITRAVATAKPIESYRSRPFVLAAFAVASLALGSWVYITREESVFGPDPAHVDSAQHDAHLRFLLFLLAQRVETYRASHGSLPSSLLDLHEDWPGIAYEVSGSTFALRGTGSDGHPIAFRSDQDVGVFLGPTTMSLRNQP